jgi:hypothetical protein
MYDKPRELRLATDEATAECLGRGDVCLVSDGKSQVLRGVLYVPGAASLMSVSRGVEDGLCFVHTCKGEPVGIHNPDPGFWCGVRKRDGMYLLEVRTVDFSVGRCGAVPPPPRHNCERTRKLHERLGHPGKSIMREIAMNGMVKDMTPQMHLVTSV